MHSYQKEGGNIDVNFCQHYIGDGSTDTNKYCRKYPKAFIACDKLWELVLGLSKSQNEELVYPC